MAAFRPKSCHLEICGNAGPYGCWEAHQPGVARYSIVSILRYSAERLHCHSVDLESGRPEDLRFWTLSDQRCSTSISDHLHFWRYIHGGVWLRCLTARDLVGILRLGA